MNPRRRAWLLALALPGATGVAAATASPSAQAERRRLVFPRDHGAHPEFDIEWWYATGWLRRDRDGDAAAPAFGFQLTFFRSRTGVAQRLDSRFAARQLLFAHAALSDVATRRLVHAERLVRWNEDPTAPLAAAALDDTRVHIGAGTQGWRFARGAAGYTARLDDRSAGFGFDLTLSTTQPLLLQGEAGFSRKGPAPDNASHYYSQVQLDVRGRLRSGPGAPQPVRGRAWLDHEWSGSLMPEGAVGWDWIGMNLDDGSALTAFRLRDARGRPVWSGGSHRTRDGALRIFDDGEAVFEPLARWSSPATRADYPVRWRLTCPAGAFEVRALFESQELDNRQSTGTVYWEGLSGLHRAADGARLGWGYLEMTGYASPLRL